MSRLLVFALLGCSGAEAVYDPEIDCRETFACCDDLGQPAANPDVAACVAEEQAILDGLSNGDRKDLDAAFAPCADLTACDFVGCALGTPPTGCPVATAR